MCIELCNPGTITTLYYNLQKKCPFFGQVIFKIEKIKSSAKRNIFVDFYVAVFKPLTGKFVCCHEITSVQNICNPAIIWVRKVCQRLIERPNHIVSIRNVYCTCSLRHFSTQWNSLTIFALSFIHSYTLLWGAIFRLNI